MLSMPPYAEEGTLRMNEWKWDVLPWKILVEKELQALPKETRRALIRPAVELYVGLKNAGVSPELLAVTGAYLDSLRLGVIDPSYNEKP